MDSSVGPHGVSSGARGGIPRLADADLVREDDASGPVTVPARVWAFRPEHFEPTPEEKFKAYLAANPYVPPPPIPMRQQVLEGVAFVGMAVAFEAAVGVILLASRTLFNVLQKLVIC